MSPRYLSLSLALSLILLAADAMGDAFADASHRQSLPTLKDADELIRASTDPEVRMSPTEIIERWGYPAEEYEVKTADGYLLTLFRIPHGRRDPFISAAPPVAGATPSPATPVAGATPSASTPVFLMHGLLETGVDFCLNLPNQSLAFVLADAGFDVWIGNARGTTHSRRHVKLDPSDNKFWEFSFDEIAEFDLPSFVDFVLTKTQKPNVYYVGHSQGTQVLFAKASEDQNFAAKIKMFFALAPVTSVGEMSSPLKWLAKLGVTTVLDAVFKLFGVGEFLPKDDFIAGIAKIFCKTTNQIICTNLLFLYAGFDVNELNMTRLPVYMAHTPAGTSVRNMVHLAQLVRSNKFASPPSYKLENMKVPTVAFWGDKDILADPADVSKMLNRVPNIVRRFHSPHLDHLDYIWGLTAKGEVYDHIVDIIKKDLAGV